MNTPAHLIMGAAVFARPDAPRVTLAAVAGAMIPDLSLYLLVGWHLWVLGTPAQVVFGELYFSEAWVRVFRVDNSFILWGIALGLALWSRRAWAIALTVAALLHLATDFMVHRDDARPQFWPLTMWIFESPVSYWDRRYYGGVVGPLEIAVALALCAYLWRQFRGWVARSLIALAALAELAPGLIWIFVPHP